MFSIGRAQVDRNKEFEAGIPKSVTINDSRFGIRVLNNKEEPTIGIYGNRGRGPNGEHQN